MAEIEGDVVAEMRTPYIAGTEGDVAAEMRSKDLAAARRALILARRLRLAAERLDDPETPSGTKARLRQDVTRAWSAFANVQQDTRMRFVLLEHLEVSALDGAPPAEVVRGFGREYPDEARDLGQHEVALGMVMTAWRTAKRGRPRRSEGGGSPWKLFADLCRKIGSDTKKPEWEPPTAETMKREWERNRPPWLLSIKRKLARPAE